MDNSELARIEYLGLNCELGFALKALDYNEPALLRWSFTPPHSVAPLINADFEDLYSPLAMVPAGLNMVRDTKFDIAFHSNLKTEIRDGEWQFIDKNVDQRRRILAAEQNLVTSQAAAFRQRFQTLDTLYVIARHDEHLPGTTAGILAAIKARSGETPFSVLEVRAAPAGAPAMDVHRVSEHFYQAQISFFAPTEHADAIDLEGWSRVLSQALQLTTRGTRAD